MPESLKIASFVFGAVLVLLALVGGGFKIFGAEVSGKAGRVGRSVAFILGVLFLLIGLAIEYDAFDKTSEASAQTKKETTPQQQAPLQNETSVDNTGSEGTQSQSPSGSLVRSIDINGTWSDANGTTYQVTQNGNSFSFVGTNQNSGGVIRGNGTINGLEFTGSYQAEYASTTSTGVGSGSISEDGTLIMGVWEDSQVGMYTLALFR